MKPLLVIPILLFLVVWILGIGWQVGYFSFLSRKIGFTRRGIHLSPLDEKAGRETGVNPEHFERRSMIQKSRGLLARGLLFGFIGVLALVILFILGTHFGVIYPIVGTIILGPALIFAHMRSNVRYLFNVLCTTPCPRCGKFPMDYSARNKDERRLLICTQCRIEWDLGPAAL
jgi:hypothetical protein